MATLNNVIANANGCVGIGTSIPTQLLDVRGNIKLGGDNTGNYIYYVKDIEGTIIRTTRSDVSQEGLLRSDGWGNFTFNKSIGLGYSLGSGPQTGNIYAAGSVGIGTSTTTSGLQIQTEGTNTTSGSFLFVRSTNASFGGGAIGVGYQYAAAVGNNFTPFRIRAGTTNAIFVVNSAGVVYAGDTTGAVAYGNHDPYFAFNQDTNTGMDWAAADTLTFKTGGTERMRIQSDGNVGIGTTSPAQKFSVIGNIYLPQGNYITWNNGDCDIGGVSGYHLVFRTYTGVSMTEKVRIQSDGNVGIGTTSPAYKLDVSGTGRVGDVFLITTATTSDARLEIGSGRSGNGNSYLDLIGDATYTDYGLRLIRYDSGANSNSRLEHRGTGQLQMFTTDAAPFTISTNSTERLRVLSGGSVGIGTSSPNALLQVAGLSTFGSGGGEYVTLGSYLDTFTGRYSIFTTNNHGDFTFGSNLVIDTNHQLKTVNTHPTMKGGAIVIGGNGYDLGEDTIAFFSQAAGSATANTIVSSSFARMVVRNTGNIGIGTTNPAAKLHLSGTGTTELRITSTSSNTNSLLSFYEVGLSSWGIDAGQANGSFFIKDLYNTRSVLTLNNNGNVGIGTTSPIQRLDLSGSLRIRSAGTYSDPTDNAGFINYDSLGGIFTISARSNGGNTYMAFRTSNSGTAGERIRIINDGNVGIGTTSPAGTLHIEGTLVMSRVSILNSAKVSINGDGTNPIFGLQLNSTTNTISIFDVFNSGGTNFAAIKGDTSNNALTFNVGASSATERIRIQSNGNVGIGTTGPVALLDVRGNTKFGSSLSNTHQFTGSVNLGGSTYNNSVAIDKFEYFSLQPYIEGGSFPSNVFSLSGTFPAFVTITGSVAPFGKVAYNTSYYEAIGDFIPVQAGETLYGEIWAYRSSGATGTAGGLYVGIARYDKDKNPIATNLALTYFITNGAVNVPLSSTWTKYSATTTLPLTHTPFNGSDGGPVRYIRPYFIINYPSGTIPTYWGGFKIRKQQLTRDTGAITISGSLGIGTSSPSSILHTAGAGDQVVRFTHTDNVVGRALTLRLTNNNATYLNSGAYVQAIQGAGIDYYSLAFGTTNNSTTSSERMRIKFDGNVGIGTTSPAYPLDVNGSINTSNFMFVSYQYGNAFPLQLTANNFLKANDYYYGMTINSGDVNYISGKFLINGGTYKRVELYGYENGIGYIPTVIPGGNLGIGTTNPGYKLDVISGSLRVSSAARASEIYFGTIDNADLYLKRDNNYDLSLVQNASSGNALYLAGAGNVYVSIDSNNNETDRAFIVQNNSVKSGTELFRVNEAGNVGIGSSSPSAKLDVVDTGNFFVTRDANAYPRFTVTNGSAQLGLFRTGTSAGGFYIGGDASLFSVWDSSFSRLVNINTSGNIGINVASPLTKLDIANTQASGITMRFDTTTNYQAWIRPYWNSTTDSRIDFAINRTSGATPDVIMSVGYGGNVGIGTTSPSALLNIVTINGSILYDNSAAGGSKVRIGSTGIAGYITEETSGKKFYIGTLDTDIRLNTGNGVSTKEFVFSSSGSLGIGTTSALSTLHLNGTAPTILTLGSTSYPSTYLTTLGVDTGARAFLIFGNNGENQIRAGRTTTGGYLDFYTNNTVAQTTLASDGNFVMRLAANGNIGIGTTIAGDKLSVFNGNISLSDSYKLFNGSSADSAGLFFSSNQVNISGYSGILFRASVTNIVGQTERMRITNDGNVGIGTSNPTALLHNYRATSTAAPITYIQEAASSPSKTNILLIERLNNLSAANISASSAGVRIRDHSSNYGLSVEDHSGNSYLVVRGGGNVGIGTSSPTSKLNAYGSGSNLSVFKAEGGNGTLFEVTDQLSGSLFSVNSIAGIPILEVFSNNRIVAGQYGSNALVISGSKVGIGLATPLSNKSLSVSGDAQVLGSLTKGSGTFLIDHPDPAKPGWKLQHSFVESPTVGDNIYRYTITIDNNLSGSIELPSYWKYLNENPQIWINPVKHFGIAYGELNEELSVMNVYANSAGKYNILLIGTRTDPTIKRLMPEFNVEFES